MASQIHIVIGGGSGFIGAALTDALRARGDRVTWISRHAGENRMTWEELAKDGLPDCDVVVNFAGQHILDMSRRWTEAYREEVIQSRIKTTKTLVEAINSKESPPEVFISTAGKCFYGTKELAAGEKYPELDEYSEQWVWISQLNLSANGKRPQRALTQTGCAISNSV